VLDNLDAVVAEVSGDGRYRFNQRQLLYKLRPIVRNELGEDLTTTNFAAIITDYEAENGEIPGMYREPRGSIYHPHRGETITLGTLMVENYERPAWTYSNLLYIEKEGFPRRSRKNVGLNGTIAHCCLRRDSRRAPPATSSTSWPNTTNP
jgi:hypothetical protein